ncbi:MAG: hypothetical protein A4C66_04515 [Nitrospira sp. HN-bin3]|nr:MAG: hypothetical protein A4C66_04515 [Nitrospira sp. HN-bin3]
MGDLARSAPHIRQSAGNEWLQRIDDRRSVATQRDGIGEAVHPHQPAPLEAGGRVGGPVRERDGIERIWGANRKETGNTEIG